MIQNLLLSVIDDHWYTRSSEWFEVPVDYFGVSYVLDECQQEHALSIIRKLYNVSTIREFVKVKREVQSK